MLTSQLWTLFLPRCYVQVKLGNFSFTERKERYEHYTCSLRPATMPYLGTVQRALPALRAVSSVLEQCCRTEQCRISPVMTVTEKTPYVRFTVSDDRLASEELIYYLPAIRSLEFHWDQFKSDTKNVPL